MSSPHHQRPGGPGVPEALPPVVVVVARSPVFTRIARTPLLRNSIMQRRRVLGPEHGGATVFACIALTGLLALTALIAALGGAVIARHRAQSAADLVALAVAGSLPDGEQPACAAGRHIALRNQIQLRECVIQEWDAVVSVSATVRLGPFGNREVRAAARAGPVAADP